MELKNPYTADVCSPFRVIRGFRMKAKYALYAIAAPSMRKSLGLAWFIIEGRT